MVLPSCLIAVDIQTGFINPATALIPSAVREFCEQNPIEHRIFTRFVNPGADGPFMKILGWSRFQEECETTLHPEVNSLPTLVLDKFTYSPFVDTKLEDTLLTLDVKDVLVFGIDTDVCVFTTAIDLFDRGFHPLVVTNLSMSHAGRQYHDAAIKILPRYIGADNVVTTADLECR
ncbi:cysteine hydrolase family protein [Candidatus Poriferisocius sp.]|uniref:cysteine hydrolase family protein n=1 Tax=Candidatus Poriferisocius sp. TaxID=3101276 RepID=UPI003B0193EC